MESIEQQMIDIELAGERLLRDGDELDTEFRRRGAAYLQRLARFDQMLARLRQANTEEQKRWATFGPPQGQQRVIANGGDHGNQARSGQDQKGDGRVQAGHAAQRVAAGA
jgi:hypothetical protein